MIEHCDLCGTRLTGRSFKRRGCSGKSFCAIRCVEAFEIRQGLPTGRIDETRPGWSAYPAVANSAAARIC